MITRLNEVVLGLHVDLQVRKTGFRAKVRGGLQAKTEENNLNIYMYMLALIFDSCLVTRTDILLINFYQKCPDRHT